MKITGEENRQYNLTELTPFTNYSVQVAAVNDEGTGPYSTPLNVTIQEGELKTLLCIEESLCIHGFMIGLVINF